MGKKNRILSLFVAVIALTLAPFWCGMPGLSLMHGAAMAAPIEAQGGCAGHACHDTHNAPDLADACACPDAADFIAVPRLKTPVVTIMHLDAAAVPAMLDVARTGEAHRSTGFSPGPPVSLTRSTLVSLRVLLLI